MLRFLTAVLVSVASALGARGQDLVTIEPVPVWVEAIDPATIKPSGSSSGGVEFLLVDEQWNAALEQTESYRHTARLVTNSSGVQSQSQVTIDFDPSRQELVVHAVRLLRAGVALDRLDAGQFQIIREERNFDQQLVDGARTALLILNDVRVGDVIDVSYTLRTEHTSFGGGLVSSFALGYSVPVGRVHVRLVTPIDRRVDVRVLGGDAQPQTIDHEETRELVFDKKRVPAVAPEANVPSWFVEYPLLQVSDYADWDAVARWAEPLFKVPEATDPAVEHAVDTLRKASSNVHDQARFALRFVQDDVRYLGIHLGAGAFEPSAPDVVINRRFGDCKDKALLLTTLLDRLGVEASAALVSTSMREHVTDLLPSPTDFDHVIVRFTIHGKTLWVDPTATNQGGYVNERTLPEYGKALIVSGPGLGLVDVVLDEGDPARTTVLNQFTIATNGPSRLTVRTTFSGSDADAWRSIVAALSNEDLARVRLEYRQRAHTGVTGNAAVQVEDDLRLNRLVLIENYSISNFWNSADPSGAWGRFTPLEVVDELVLVEAGSRKAPVALNPGRHVIVNTVAALPGPYQIEAAAQRVDLGGVRARSAVRLAGRTLTLETEYQALGDHVSKRDTAQYRDRIEQFRQQAGYEIAKPDPRGQAARTGPPEPSVWVGVLGALFMLALALGLVFGLKAARRSTTAGASADWASPARAPVVEGPVVWRRDNVLVIERGSALPKRCVVCNAETSTSVERQFRWHDPALYFTILLGVIVYVIVGTILSKRASVKIGICDEHISARRKSIVIAWTAAATGLVLIIVALQIGSVAPGLVGFAFMIAAAIWGQKKAAIMTVKRIDEVSVHVKGAGHPFLESIERRAA